jgi:8-oxo-dGTP diphosphatase
VNTSPRHSVSVAAVITDDHGRALLIQRADNCRWEPPGVVLELGETIHDGLRREVSIHGSRRSAWVVVRPGEGSLTCG